MDLQAHVFDIKRDCSEDGPGIRTTVFFKGCPLSCVWCQNPEGKNDVSVVSYNESLCKPAQCDVACVSVCETHCLSFVDKLYVDFEQCVRCDKCFAVCPTHALEPVGYGISLDELLYRVMIDEAFFRSSGGGVTLSGGEATQQMEFSGKFLQALKQRSVHTALETSGFFNFRKFTDLMLPYLDLIYFDLKLMGEKASHQYTGQSNRLILENFEKLVQDNSINVIPRIPLIPGITATEKNLKAIAIFLKRHGIDKAVLLPYNPLWTDKLKYLGLKSSYERHNFMSAAELEHSIQYFKSFL